VIATTTVSAALSDWREETRSLVWAAGLAAAIICLMLFFITRYLKEQHRTLDVAVNNMSQALLLFDRSERLVICNKRYLEMFGLSSEVVKPGCKLRDLIQYRKAGIEKNGFGEKYSLYSLRHFYAVTALRNGIGVFEVARNMGTSVQMIQQYYGKQATAATFATRLGD
jgi:PAS domain-containing protein